MCGSTTLSVIASSGVAFSTKLIFMIPHIFFAGDAIIDSRPDADQSCFDRVIPFFCDE